ncbi:MULTISPECIES: CbtB domain-containing protein [Azospirillum]|uniref:CbtB-domain containing protein n=1 Tax=Azospirillum lipoferum TaxID=193 RepID=A0A5A9GM70_AZOLI|nr:MULTISPECIES: CbtB-domain containing protein [Azospirillum]KAA0594915.1 hypothetical protein FZ942_19115 [Azospirillum lipoferum]MDW5532108.1 CbtB-domain containing protein [Azospirillum sp. NL1]
MAQRGAGARRRGGRTLAAVCSSWVGVSVLAASLIHGSYVHEFVHDGRHLLGFPCH